MARIAGAIWVTLFGVLLTFVMGVIVWAVAGPVLAILIYVAAIVLFIVLPFKLRGRNDKKAAPR